MDLKQIRPNKDVLEPQLFVQLSRNLDGSAFDPVRKPLRFISRGEPHAK